MQVGTLDALFRYPVKSLGGEQLIRSRLDTAGLPGDRILGLRDEENGEILSAKRLPRMLGLQAHRDEASGGVVITTASGELIDSADPFASARLSAELGRVVSLMPLVEEDTHYRRRVPLNPDGVRRLLGLSLQDELPSADVPDAVRSVLRQYVTWPGTYFDVAPLHLVTRQSLDALSGGLDDIADPQRYRANLVLDCKDLGDWPEQAWIGQRLCIDDAVIAITQATVRCAMPRYAQRDLPDNPAVSNSLRDRTGYVFGVYARVIRHGELLCGAEVGLEPEPDLRQYYDIPAFARPNEEVPGPKPRGDMLFRVTEVIRESAEISSIWMQPVVGQMLPFLPGQHVIVRLPGQAAESRVYSISSGAGEAGLRISVRCNPARKAGFTARLVGQLKPGDELRIRGPLGEFTAYPASLNPLVLASAGIGITPFLSILRSTIAYQPQRPIHLFHCVENPAGFAFEAELQTALRHLPNLFVNVHAKLPGEGGERLVFSQKRLDGATLVSSPLFALGAPIMICGSPQFADGIASQLRALGIDDARWASEQFVPAGSIGFDNAAATEGPYRVKVNSEIEGTWSGAANLLEWIEATGHSVPSGCRYGACGGCSARLIAGTVEYPVGLKVPDDPATVLLCVARPKCDVKLEAQLYPGG